MTLLKKFNIFFADITHIKNSKLMAFVIDKKYLQCELFKNI